MIQNKTARRLMYEWHSGQWSAFYAAASSGLIESFCELDTECETIDNPTDRQKMREWIHHRKKADTRILINGRAYVVLPWARCYRF